QQLALIDAHAGRRAEVGAEDLRHDAGLLLVPVRLAGAARVVAVVAAGDDVADARLLVAVVVVVADEDVAEAIDTRLVLVAEVVGDQLQVLAVEVAAPDGAGPAVGAVARPLAALAVGRLQAAHTRVTHREIQLHVGADEDAVDAVVVVE